MTGKDDYADREILYKKFMWFRVRPKEDLPKRKKATRMPPVFESHAAYLDRYGLLTDDEREALPGDAFERLSLWGMSLIDHLAIVLLMFMVQVLDGNPPPTAQDLQQKLLQQFPNILFF
jgi:hypothetical protein